MATLEEADNFLVGVENLYTDLKDKYSSKTNERVLSSHVWMIDYISNAINKKVTPLKDSLSMLRDQHVGDFKSSTQFDALLKFCDEINKILNDINQLYKMRSNVVDIKLKFQYALPQIQDKLKHMRNRFNIIKSQLSKKQFELEEDWP